MRTTAPTSRPPATLATLSSEVRDLVKQSWFWFLVGSVVVAACGDAATVDAVADPVHDAGEDVVGEVDAGMLGAAGGLATVAGSWAGEAGSVGAAAAGAAGSAAGAGAGAAGAAGSAAGSAAGAGAAGSVGAAGAAGAAGTGAAGAAAGAGGSAAGAGGGSGGGVQPYACPLGSTDADGNGYPDACETVLTSTINLAARAPGTSGSGNSYAFYTTTAYFVLQRALSPADSAQYPGCDQAINAVGQAYPVHAGAAETRTFDVRTDANLQAFIACERTFLAHPNGVSKLSPLNSQLLFNVHSTWPQDRTGTGSNQWASGNSVMATLTPNFTIVYARREVIAYTADSFSGRWTLHGYRTPK